MVVLIGLAIVKYCHWHYHCKPAYYQCDVPSECDGRWRHARKFIETCGKPPRRPHLESTRPFFSSVSRSPASPIRAEKVYSKFEKRSKIFPKRLYFRYCARRVKILTSVESNNKITRSTYTGNEHPAASARVMTRSMSGGGGDTLPTYLLCFVIRRWPTSGCARSRGASTLHIINFN